MHFSIHIIYFRLLRTISAFIMEILIFNIKKSVPVFKGMSYILCVAPTIVTRTM